MDCGEGKPVGELVRFQIGKGKHNERGEQGRAGVYRSVVDGVPHLRNMITLELRGFFLASGDASTVLTVLPA